MQRPLQIGVTGGIGSGKSLVCKIFECLKVPIYNADERAKYLMSNNRELIASIKDLIGKDAYTVDGSLDRKKIGEVAFNAPEKLNKLNELVHPAVALDYSNWVDQNKGRSYLVKEAALLFDAGTNKSLHKVIVVHAPEVLRIQRVVKRDGRSVDDIRKILDQQLPEEERIQRADYVITNDESVLVIPQVIELHQKFSAGFKR